ncbi:PREDICTED: uncharacterized protein LOC108771638 [Cyphomyrmex costatus]|uniref:uncharacterized protein LOC108771638 n=1 Tax=Cyphomyrmex costatus TaxID=456900 RepID=UPI0008524437|nr:PREDICTED: uncharacterized protein LOC108771638 [Cyphomyrmex costatus]
MDGVCQELRREQTSSKHITGSCKKTKVKYLLKQLKLDWNSIEDSGEIRILEKYAIENRVVTLILCFCSAFGMFALITVEFTPIVLDAVIYPINKSRSRKIIVDFEFFIDENQYFYIYLISEVVLVLTALLTILATGTLLLALLRHYCATLKIARYMSLWYKAPVTVQKLLLFMMQITSKSLVPNIGGLYVSVLESFTTVSKMALSFAMILYSCNTTDS